MAAALADDAETVTPLEEFWLEQTSRYGKGEASDQGGGIGHSRARAISTVSAVMKDEESLPDYHPALSILRYLDVFGPLVFRLQQAALLRKRILFVGIPPVRTACEFGMFHPRLHEYGLTSQCTTSLSSLAYRPATLDTSYPALKNSCASPRSSPSACTTYPILTSCEIQSMADTHPVQNHQRDGLHVPPTRS
jgi:hypothetical protein